MTTEKRKTNPVLHKIRFDFPGCRLLLGKKLPTRKVTHFHLAFLSLFNFDVTASALLQIDAFGLLRLTSLCGA